mmetsp:Transcript_56148/g.169836  ORF Transcript_56148/g.169836 Transcript_56148/m.169836 type:complete len:269 (-) Transcript_56148:34-840(-)
MQCPVLQTPSLEWVMVMRTSDATVVPSAKEAVGAAPHARTATRCCNTAGRSHLHQRPEKRERHRTPASPQSPHHASVEAATQARVHGRPLPRCCHGRATAGEQEYPESFMSRLAPPLRLRLSHIWVLPLPALLDNLHISGPGLAPVHLDHEHDLVTVGNVYLSPPLVVVSLSVNLSSMQEHIPAVDPVRLQVINETEACLLVPTANDALVAPVWVVVLEAHPSAPTGGRHHTCWHSGTAQRSSSSMLHLKGSNVPCVLEVLGVHRRTL